jgi:hypothetical protein
MAQVVQHLPRKCEALSSNPMTKERRKEGKRKRKGRKEERKREKETFR